MIDNKEIYINKSEITKINVHSKLIIILQFVIKTFV